MAATALELYMRSEFRRDLLTRDRDHWDFSISTDGIFGGNAKDDVPIQELLRGLDRLVDVRYDISYRLQFDKPVIGDYYDEDEFRAACKRLSGKGGLAEKYALVRGKLVPWAEKIHRHLPTIDWYNILFQVKGREIFSKYDFRGLKPRLVGVEWRNVEVEDGVVYDLDTLDIVTERNFIARKRTTIFMFDGENFDTEIVDPGKPVLRNGTIYEYLEKARGEMDTEANPGFYTDKFGFHYVPDYFDRFRKERPLNPQFCTIPDRGLESFSMKEFGGFGDAFEDFDEFIVRKTP